MLVFLQNLLQEQRLIGGDVIHVVLNEPLHVFGIIYSPCIDLHAEGMALFYPLRLLAEYCQSIIGTSASQVFQCFWGEVAVQVVYRRARKYLGRHGSLVRAYGEVSVPR